MERRSVCLLLSRSSKALALAHLDDASQVSRGQRNPVLLGPSKRQCLRGSLSQRDRKAVTPGHRQQEQQTASFFPNKDVTTHTTYF
ncbi:unnamed protein product [Ixodes pacificus]